ncbi:hypothetical protein [Streptomyces caelestis]|uniref:Uncharacterized protein n=1 Tax=Streptomyces caelestis TaxID=36816 RepID=A0A7W9H9A2_9ACTN|nr:hypothetical protein [Streptomyces caelestis]MBB5798062.1 hypothetical protein [Streptomyces caelestis]GGW66225.1 hypothetical protein GCM10010320_54460 [Streptomyces caelestis]
MHTLAEPPASSACGALAGETPKEVDLNWVATRSSLSAGAAYSRTRVTVIAATGYRPNLHAPVGSLGVLDEAGQPLAVGARTLPPPAARLYFAGYTNPLTGVLRQAGIEAHAIAYAFRREKERAPFPPPALATARPTHSTEGTLRT